jgi:hypothetical protein
MLYYKVIYNYHRDNKTLVYWGFVYDLRSFLRTSMGYSSFPKFFNLVKVSTPLTHRNASLI